MFVPMLEFENVKLSFHRQREVVRAVNGVSFSLNNGATLGVVGESGSGKSTVGRLAARLLIPDDGIVRFQGSDLAAVGTRDMRTLRARIQVVFQEPYEQLNPRFTVERNIAEPLMIHSPEIPKLDRRRAIAQVCDLVALPEGCLSRYPQELSGGQQQRVGIARALVTEPSMIVLDEPTSSLDLSVRAQIIDLLKELRQSLKLTYLFISHDMETVEDFCDRVVVMYAGRVVESGPTKAVLATPAHPFTRALVAARLSPDPSDQLRALPLRPRRSNDAAASAAGCAFAQRCPRAIQDCLESEIALADSPTVSGVRIACIRPHDAATDVVDL